MGWPTTIHTAGKLQNAFGACQVVVQKGHLPKIRGQKSYTSQSRTRHGATCLDPNFRLICLRRL